MDLAFWLPVIVGGALAGGSTAALGVCVVAMRIPFLGVCVAHAALAGAVLGGLFGLGGSWLLLPALLAASATALALGWLPMRWAWIDSNSLMGVLFSLSMGVAFLGLGLYPQAGRPDNEVRQLLWGSLAFCRWSDVGWIAGSGLLLGAFLVGLAKEMRAVMFSREQALAAGIRVAAVWTGFLLLASLTTAANFQTVGGLMIYGLMINPALAAFQLTRGYGRSLALAAALGAGSGVGGFFAAAALDLPVGATIVLLSSLLVFAAAGLRRCGGVPAPRRG